jgi:hypothetical protein
MCTSAVEVKVNSVGDIVWHYRHVCRHSNVRGVAESWTEERERERERERKREREGGEREGERERERERD